MRNAVHVRFILVMSFIILLCALVLDALFSEVKRFHPLVGFGRFASWLEKIFREADPSSSSPSKTFAAGLIALVMAVVPFVVLTALTSLLHPALYGVCSAVVLYFCLGASSLKRHSQAVYAALVDQDIKRARKRVSMIVSRDTQSMSENQIRKAVIESHLENGADAIFATIFWFALGGAPLAVLHRLVNTLDAMWGYTSPKYLYFGRAAAKLDDLLNYIPARLVAFSYACLGNYALARKSWKSQASNWSSPNAGPVMSAGAGALDVQLGGPAMYHGTLIERPSLGSSTPPSDKDINRALVLVDQTLVVWCCAFAGVTGLVWYCAGA